MEIRNLISFVTVAELNSFTKAAQAMYISQAKGYKDGMSAIISSADFNFWDDIALKSYAEVVSKRHSQLGINFEEELLNKHYKICNFAIPRVLYGFS